jgi:hypothetical protein
MVTPELLDYIKKQLQSGKSKEELRDSLLNRGWQEADIESAFQSLSGFSFRPMPQAAPPSAASQGQPAAKPIAPSESLSAQAKDSGSGQPQPVSQARQTPAVGIQGSPQKQMVDQTGRVKTEDDFSDEEMAQVYGYRSSANKAGKKKIWPIILMVFGVLLLISGAAAAAYFFYFQSPSRIIAKLTAQMSGIKSAKYSGTADVSIKTTGDPFKDLLNNGQSAVSQIGSPFSAGINLDFTLQFNGAADSSDPNQPQGFLKLDLKSKGPSDGELQEFLGLELRTIKEVVYIGLVQLPNLPEISGLKDKWLKIDPVEIGDYLKTRGLTDEQLQDFDKAISGQTISQEKLDKIKKLVADLKMPKITAKLAGEKIDGQDTYHYQYLVDKASFKKLIEGIDEIMGVQMPVDTQVQFNKALDSYSDITGELWIGKKDSFLHKFTMDFGIDLKEPESEFSSQMKITVSLFDYNKSVAVETPSVSLSFVDLLTELGDFFGPVDCSKQALAVRDDCYLQEATKAVDSQNCQKIIDAAKKYNCYIQIAKLKKDQATCNQILNRSWKDECYRVLAKEIGHVSLCQNIYYLNWKNYCLAGVLKDASYCQKMTQKSARDTCLSEVGK